MTKVSNQKPQMWELAKLPDGDPGLHKHSFSYIPSYEKDDMQISTTTKPLL